MEKKYVNLVWSDEFDYVGLPDPTKWSYDVGGHGWGNQESQYYTEARKENAYVSDGKLTITAIKEEYQNMHYTSARLITKGKGDFKYGRIEVCAKLPTGKGSWPAIWMLPTEWKFGGWPDSGEIDIMEQVGFNPNQIHFSLHTLKYNHPNNTQKTAITQLPDCTENFHVYAIEWEEKKIKFFIEDKMYFETGLSEEDDNDADRIAAWPFTEKFHILLNIAVGGFWGGAEGIDDSIFPIKMEVKYVRVYQ